MSLNRTTAVATFEKSLLKKHWNTLIQEKLDYFDSLVSCGLKSLPIEETDYVEHVKLAEFKEMMLKKILVKNKEKEKVSTYSDNRYKKKIQESRQQKKEKFLLVFVDHLYYEKATSNEKNRIMELQYRVCKLELLFRDLSVEVESLTYIPGKTCPDNKFIEYINSFSSIIYITTRPFTQYFNSLDFKFIKDILLNHATLTDGAAASLYMQKSGHPEEKFLPDILRTTMCIYGDTKFQGLFHLITGIFKLPFDYDGLKETESFYNRLESISKKADFNALQYLFAALRNDHFKTILQNREKPLLPAKTCAGTSDEKQATTPPAAPAATTAAAASHTDEDETCLPLAPGGPK